MKLKAILTESQETLYHGSDHPHLETYDLSKLRTAGHIYTTSDPDTAKGYGKHLYIATPKPGLKYFNMLPDDMGIEEHKVLKQLYVDMDAENDLDMDLQQFVDFVTSSEVYQYDMSSRIQDDIMATLNSYGYDVIMFADAGFGGGWSISYVFFDPAHLSFSPAQ